jgi:hypothetical protein
LSCDVIGNISHFDWDIVRSYLAGTTKRSSYFYKAWDCIQGTLLR